MGTDSPDVVIAQRLLDYVKLRGFEFWRAAPGEDGPLVGHRVSGDWVDIIHIEGFKPRLPGLASANIITDRP